jgi:hypothetical protein
MVHILYAVIAFMYNRQNDHRDDPYDVLHYISSNRAEAKQAYHTFSVASFNLNRWRPYKKLLVRFLPGEIRDGLVNEEVVMEEELEPCPPDW